MSYPPSSIGQPIPSGIPTHQPQPLSLTNGILPNILMNIDYDSSIQPILQILAITPIQGSSPVKYK